MFKKFKRGVLTGLAGIILLSGCSTISVKPTGGVDLAYVPIRMDDKIQEGFELMAELDIAMEAKVERGVLEGAMLRVGGRQRTYMEMGDILTYYPNRQEYDTYGEVEFKNFTFYMFHMCSHPVDGEVELIYDRENIQDSLRILNTDVIRKIGLRWRF